ncbi:MAG: helix-turn-helix domain-containing protein [Pseudonocardiales bacterium]
MTTSNPAEQDTPPRPAAVTTVADFGRSLRALRRWSELTQKALEDAHPALTDSTISDHERGTRLPRFEWLHAYVVACLRHRRPNSTREELNAEMTYWRAAWTRLEHAQAPQAPAVPTPRAADLTTPPEPAPVSVAVAVGELAPPPRRVRVPRGRVLLISGGAAVLVIAVAVYAAVTGLFDRKPDDPGPVVHASGTVDDLRGVEGIDLDTNTRADQEAEGVDISPAATATHLNAMANRVTFTVLPESGAESRDRCVKAVDWMRQIPNIYDLVEGRQICVMTDEGRFSMLTLTKRSSAASPVMNFHYTTWN